MRNAVSVRYQGNWADRVAKMSDAQVAAIYQRTVLNSTKQKENKS